MLQRRFGLALASIVAAGVVWACTVSRKDDGSFTIKFAPDMVITAWGLEDALSKLTDLLDECITGNFARPCTLDEMSEINKAIETVTKQKPGLEPGLIDPS